jgi:hypothetical protein
LSWALHRAPESGLLAVVVKRGGAEKSSSPKQLKLETGEVVLRELHGRSSHSLSLELPADWRRKSDISRRVATWPMRGMAFGGMTLEDLADDARAERGLTKEKMALFVKGLGQFGKNAAAKNAGFQKEDVIVELAGMSWRTTEGELLGQLLQQHFPGEKVKATVLRGSQRLVLSLPMQ